MKKRPKKGPADPDISARQLLAPGREIARRMAMQALNACHRDKIEARRLFKQWLKENDDLLEAVAGPAITLQITIAVSQDVRIERQDVLKQSRALPIVENGVAVGGAVPPRSACIPIPSAESSDRAAARVAAHGIQLMGLHLLPLPGTGKPLGEACAWELKDACIIHLNRMKGDSKRAHLFAFAWQALPDKDKPASEQKPVYRQLDLNTLRILDQRAQMAGEKLTLLAEGVA